MTAAEFVGSPESPAPPECPVFDGRRWTNATADVVALMPADPEWPSRYAGEARAIRATLGPEAVDIRIEHVGSTAVPGLAAKPIIDLPPDRSRRVLARQGRVRGRVLATSAISACGNVAACTNPRTRWGWSPPGVL